MKTCPKGEKAFKAYLERASSVLNTVDAHLLQAKRRKYDRKRTTGKSTFSK